MARAVTIILSPYYYPGMFSQKASCRGVSNNSFRTHSTKNLERDPREPPNHGSRHSTRDTSYPRSDYFWNWLLKIYFCPWLTASPLCPSRLYVIFVSTILNRERAGSARNGSIQNRSLDSNPNSTRKFNVSEYSTIHRADVWTWWPGLRQRIQNLLFDQKLPHSLVHERNRERRHPRLGR